MPAQGTEALGNIVAESEHGGSEDFSSYLILPQNRRAHRLRRRGWALLLLAVFAVPTVLTSTWRPAVERSAQERAAQSHRLARHLFTIATTAPPGKEVRSRESESASLHGVLSESLKIAGDDREKIRRAYSLGLAEFDAEHRFYVPFQDIANDHFAGRREASEQYLKLLANNQRLRYGDGLPPMRGNWDHRIIMKTGLGLGLENLRASNLARFFDRFCPCFEVHDADVLRKLRKRILDEGRKARETVMPKFSGVNQKIV